MASIMVQTEQGFEEVRLADLSQDLLKVADRIQAVPEADRGGRFAFAGGRRRNRGHEDQFAVLPVVQVFQKVIADLGLVVAERNNVIRRQTKFCRNVTDGFFVRSLCDFDVRRYLAHILDLHVWLLRVSIS